MPLITLNLKPPKGLSFHHDLISNQAAKSMNKPPISDTDLLLVPRSGSPIVSHQAVLASLSPLLAQLFKQYSCASQPIVLVHLDLDLTTVKNILDIVYTGSVVLDTKDKVDQVNNGLTMLDIDISIEQAQTNQPISPLATPLPLKVGVSRKRSLLEQQSVQRSAKRARGPTSNNTSAVDYQDNGVTLFNCDNCDMNFKLRKGLKSHVQKTHKQDKGSEMITTKVVSPLVDICDQSPKQSKQVEITSFFTPTNIYQKKSGLNVNSTGTLPRYSPSKLLSCVKCSKTFPLTNVLQQHLASIHYAKQLLPVYPGQACPFFTCQHSEDNYLLKLEHIALNHPSAVNCLLKKEGLPPVQPCPSDISLTPHSPIFHTSTCQLCHQAPFSPSALAVHYMTVHYQHQLDSWDTSACQVCGAVFHTGAGRGRFLQHLALRHTEVVAFMMERDGLWVGNGEVFREGEGGYRNKAVRVDVGKIADLRILSQIEHIKKRKQGIRRRSSGSLSKNRSSDGVPGFSDYVKIEVDPARNIYNPNLSCFLCGIDYTDVGEISLLAHLSTTHYRLEIERTYMTRPGAVWATSNHCPLCDEVVRDWEMFIHHVGVEHRAVEKFIPDKFRLAEGPSGIKTETATQLCVLPDCTRQFDSERNLLVHLVMSHYYQQMEDMFGDKFRADSSKCFKCKKNLPSNKVGFMKHLGVDHGVVMELVSGKFDADSFKCGKQVKKENDPLA